MLDFTSSLGWEQESKHVFSPKRSRQARASEQIHGKQNEKSNQQVDELICQSWCCVEWKMGRWLQNRFLFRVDRELQIDWKKNPSPVERLPVARIRLRLTGRQAAELRSKIQTSSSRVELGRGTEKGPH
jgi:hypothetical protein